MVGHIRGVWSECLGLLRIWSLIWVWSVVHVGCSVRPRSKGGPYISVALGGGVELRFGGRLSLRSSHLSCGTASRYRSAGSKYRVVVQR